MESDEFDAVLFTTDLHYKRDALIAIQPTEEAKKYQQWIKEYNQYGYIRDRQDAIKATKIRSHFEKIILRNTDVLFVTTSMASTVIDSFRANVLILDESA